MIKSNKVLEKLRSDKPSLGGWVMTGSIVSAEIMAQAGFDWVCVDVEHSAVNLETVSQMFTAIEAHNSEPFARIALNDEVEFKKYLDMGATGIIVPMIKSYEDVKRAISYSKYSPMGNRSFALPKATGYGTYAQEYFRNANDNIFLGIMIEHIDALKELDKIFSVKNIDAVLVGPYDLSGSMGIPGQFEDNLFKEVLKEITLKAKEHNIKMGIHEVHPNEQKIAGLIKDGYRFIACGIDTLFILEMSKHFSSLTIGDLT
jgi:2-dehydro-3-deoxyglucarate aldolase